MITSSPTLAPDSLATSATFGGRARRGYAGALGTCATGPGVASDAAGAWESTADTGMARNATSPNQLTHLVFITLHLLY